MHPHRCLQYTMTLVAGPTVRVSPDIIITENIAPALLFVLVTNQMRIILVHLSSKSKPRFTPKASCDMLVIRGWDPGGNSGNSSREHQTCFHTAPHPVSAGGLSPGSFCLSCATHNVRGLVPRSLEAPMLEVACAADLHKHPSDQGVQPST